MAESALSAFTQLPVVDISGLYSAALDERKGVAKALGDAASGVGFLYITGHGISRQRIDDLIQCSQNYFAQPLDKKLRDYIGHSVNHSGYVPEGEEQLGDYAQRDSAQREGIQADSKEAFDINFDYCAPTGRRPMLGPNQWPDFPRFKDVVKSYYDDILALSKVLFRGFALALGLPEDRLSNMVTTPPSQLRLIHYPFSTKASADSPGIGAHTDYECFTILLPTAPGLEVLNGAGQWVDVPLLEDAFIINIGDMLEVLSNGRFIATSHRVRKVQEERYSFPFFCSCDYDTVIAPLSELDNTAGAMAGYSPVRCGDHLYAQTIQTFSYLKDRLALGEIELPEGSRGLSSFGYHAMSDANT